MFLMIHICPNTCHLFFKGLFIYLFILKMVNDVVRGSSVNLLDKLAKVNYLHTHTTTSIYLFISFLWGVGRGRESPLRPKNDFVLNSKL